jgi:hypothetical protein
VSSDDPRNITVLANAEEADEKLQGLLAGAGGSGSAVLAVFVGLLMG